MPAVHLMDGQKILKITLDKFREVCYSSTVNKICLAPEECTGEKQCEYENKERDVYKLR